MNVNLTDERFYLRVLMISSFFIALIVLFASAFRSPSRNGNPQTARGTKTALALTQAALLGPFPTATGPTPTSSPTPRPTMTPSLTPTITPTRTPFRYFIDTAVPREQNSNRNTAIPGLPGSTAAPVNTPISVNPTSTPEPVEPTIEPTDPPATEPPVLPTEPPAVQPTECVNPQGHPIPCH